MTSPRIVALLAMLVMAVLGSCVDGNGPFQPGPSRTATLSLQPVLSAAAQAGEAPDIHRIRVRVLQVPGEALLLEETFEVDPNAESWPLELEFPIPEEGIDVLIEIELINVTDGVETVEFSGVVGPLSVTSGESSEIQQVEVVRGPLGNLGVTAVTVTPTSPPALHPGDTTRLVAQVTTSEPESVPVLFWSSLAPGVASVDGTGLVTGLAPGVAGIVATAGPRADTVQVTVLEPPVDADLRVTKTTNRATALEGDTVLFTVAVTNLGPAGATAVQLRDSLGAGLGFLSAQVTRGSFDGVGGIWVIPTLGPGGTDTLRLRARVANGAGGGLVTNTAWSTLRAGEPDPVSGNDTARVTVSVGEPTANLAVGKTVDRGLAFEGDTVTFTISIENTGPNAGTGVRVEDLLPEGLTLVEALAGADGYDPETGLWAVGDLAVGGADTLRLRARVDSGTLSRVITNTARSLGSDLADPDEGDDVAQASLVVDERLADLAVQKDVDVAAPFEGDTVTFTISLTNQGPEPARGTRVFDPLPTGLTYVSSTATSGSYDAVSGAWTLGEQPVGMTDTLRLRVRVDSGTVGQEITNVAGPFALAQERDPNPDNDRDSASVVVDQRVADVAVTKTVDEALPFETDTVTFEVVVANAGPSAATGVSVHDTLPTGVLLVSSTATRGSWSPSTGVWTVGDIAAGDADTLKIRATVDAGSAGTPLWNVARSQGLEQEFDPDPANDADSASVTLQGIDLEVTKSVDVASPDVADTVTFTVTLTNHGPNAATGVVVGDPLPAGLTFASATASAGSYATGTGAWSIASLTAGASAILTLKATVDAGAAGQTITNTASVAASDQIDSDGGNDAASASLTVPAIDLAVAQGVDDTTPDEGQTLTLLVTVVNAGPSTATGVVLSDALPAGLTLVSATPSQGTYDSGGGLWTVGTIAADGSVNLVLTVTVDAGTAGQTITNTATVTAADQTDTDASNDAASVSVTVTAVDLGLAKAVDDATPDEGQTVTFTVTLTNTGPDAATGVSVSDPVPAGLTFVSATPSTGSYGSGTGVWTVGSVAAGGSATLTLVATVDAGTRGQTITNTATVTASSQADTNVGNDGASASLTVTAVDLGLAKAADDATPDEGQTVTFTVTLTNVGPDAASGVSVSDPLPAGLTFSSATPSVGSYDTGTGIWTVGALAAGGSATLSLAATVDAGTAAQTITNTATVAAADQADTSSVNDQASAPVTVTAVDLALAKGVDDATPDEGQTVTYSVTLANAGPDVATGVVVTDVLPAGVTFASSTPSVGSYDSGTGDWTVGTLGAGSATLAITATVDGGTATQTITNTATLTAVDQADTNAGNDAASTSLTVNVSPQNLSYGTPGNTQMIAGAFAPPATPHMTHVNGVLAGTPGLTVTSTGTFSSIKGGTVVMEADGDFSYVPPAGLALPDTFTYTVDTGASATVEVVLSGMIWYVNNTVGAGGTGVSDDPFSTLGNAAGASAPGQRIYVHEGDGTTTGYGTGIFLQANQVLEGEGVDLVVGADTLFPAGAPPHLSDPGTSPAVTMASGSTVRGVFIDAPGNDGIRASGIAGGTIDQVSILTPIGDGLEISNSTGTFTVTALDVENATGAAVNVTGGSATISVDVLPGSLTNTTGRVLVVSGTTGGSVSFTGGDITDAGGTGVRIENNAGAVSIANALSVNTAADTALIVTGNSGAVTLDSLDLRTTIYPAAVVPDNTGTVTLAGTVVTTASAGLSMSNSDVAAAFDSVTVDNSASFNPAVSLATLTGSTAIGHLSLTSGPNAALSATNAGVLEITGANSTVTSTTGRGVNIQNTTIGAAGVTLRSVSANGGAPGITLVNTGTTGLFSVTGDGATPGSGGTIQNNTDAAVRLNNVAGVALEFMNITNADSTGIFGSTVTGLSLRSLSITGNGDTFGEHGIHFVGLTGTALMDDVTATGNFEDNARVTMASGTLALDLNSSSFSSSNPAGGGTGFTIALTGAATATVDAVGSTFDGNDTHGFEGTSDNASMLTVTTDGSSTFDSNGGNGMTLVDIASRVDIDLRNSSFMGNNNDGISLQTLATSTAGGGINGVIEGNTVTAAVTGDGVNLQMRGAAKSIVQILNNTGTIPTGTDGAGFLSAAVGSFFGSDTATLDLTVDGNLVTFAPGSSDTAMRLDSQGASTMCLAFGTNNAINYNLTTSQGVSGGQTDASTFNVAELATNPPFATFIADRLTAMNLGASTEATGFGTFTSVASCQTPP